MYSLQVEIQNGGWVNVTNFINWEATILNSDITTSITPYTEFTNVEFFGDGYNEIKQALTNNKWTQPVPVKVTFLDGGVSLLILKGVIDGESVILDDTEQRLFCNIEVDAKNDFTYQVSGRSIFSFGTEHGVIDVCVVSEDDWIAVLTVALATFVLGKTAYEQTQSLIKLISEYIAHSTGGLSGPVSGAIWFGVNVALHVAYIGFLVYSIAKFIIELIKQVIARYSRERIYNMHQILNSIASHTNYTIDAPQEIINDMKKLFFVKPTPDMYGWEVTEFMELIKLIFNAKIFIYDKTIVIFHSTFSNFLYTNIYYNFDDMPVLTEYKYNISDLYGRFLIKQGIDSIDTYSVKASGRYYEYINNGFKRFSRQEVPLPSGIKKDSQSTLEKIVSKFLSVFAKKERDKFDNRTKNAIQVSSQNFQTKLIYIQNAPGSLAGGQVVNSDNTIFKGLGEIFQKYYEPTMAHKSQRIIYSKKEFPFVIDYLSSKYFIFLINNKYYVDKLTWKLFSDEATLYLSEPKQYNNSKYESKII